MTRSVSYSLDARRHLTGLYEWIADESGYPDRAERYVSAILDYCDSLADVPFVGVARDDLRPGIRTIGFRSRVVIAFSASDELVEILGIYYGGRNYEIHLQTGAQ